MISATTPRGIVIKKISRHRSASPNAPPRMGPPTVTTVVKDDQVPMALPLSFSSMEEDISDKLPGIIKAPPAPWMILQMIGAVVDGERPQAKDPAKKTRIPGIKPFFRPSRSPSDPPTRISDASIRR